MNERQGAPERNQTSSDEQRLSEERKILEQLESDDPSHNDTPPAQEKAEASSPAPDRKDPDVLLSDTLLTLRRLIDEVRDVLAKEARQEEHADQPSQHKEE